MGARTVENWVDELQSRGQYTFVRSDVLENMALSQEAVKKALQRLVRRGRILKLKDYFYVIVPLEYLAASSPPVSWFVHDLMAAMETPYYVGLLSAAAQHGASHQQPQQFQVVTDRSVRPLDAGRTQVRFFASKYVSDVAVQDVKTPTGTMRTATPETTAVDLVRFARACGHLNNVTTVLSELAPVLDNHKLLKAVRLVNDVPNAKRLGYLLDRVGATSLSEPLHDWLTSQSPRTVPLQSGRTAKDAPWDRRWRILVNHEVEVDV